MREYVGSQGTVSRHRINPPTLAPQSIGETGK
jgi:hypothetical protein